MLALIFLGHFRVVTGILDTTLFSMGMTQGGVDTLSAVAGGGAGIVVLATGLLLLFRRITIIRVRQISGFPDFFALLLLLAIFITGDIMRFWNHIELEQTRIWARSLLTFSPVVPQHTMFLLHAMLAQFLFVYIPFSKVMHFGGIFFTQALIKRR
jgi:nitrate reductase gamma subunit